MLAQLVPPSWALRLTYVSRPCQKGFPIRKLTTTIQNVTQTLKSFGLQDQMFLEFAALPANMTVLSNGLYVSVTSELVMLPRGHGPTTMGQTPRWQQVPASGTR